MSTMMRFKDEKEYQDLMAKRSGWTKGSVIEYSGRPSGGKTAAQELAMAKFTQDNPNATVARGRHGEWIIEKPIEDEVIEQDTPQAAAMTVTSFAGLKRASSRAQSSRTAPGALRGSQAATLPKSLEVARKQSGIEVLFAQQIDLLQVPAPKRNYLFMPGRKLELDFAWPERMIAVEVQGMVHRIKGRFNDDMEKRALALLAGWRILEIGGREIRSGKAATWIQQLMQPAVTTPDGMGDAKAERDAAEAVEHERRLAEVECAVDWARDLLVLLDVEVESLPEDEYKIYEDSYDKTISGLTGAIRALAAEQNAAPYEKVKP